MNKVELLSPVGSYEGLIGVINAGANAVYLSGKSYGARAYANNFEPDELIEAIKLAHLFNVKVYLTLNTLIKQSEIKNIINYLTLLVDNKLDGIIVQDLGAIKLINDNFKNLEIHLSTQLSVSGYQSIEYFKKCNVTRIVPARELSLDEIKLIKNKTNIEIESFIHGAMCYSYSGMCLFSAYLGGRSGNRGRCAQPCRLPYHLNGKNECYPLSMKDMCTIDILPSLIEAGIDSFKIEGRMKAPEYAAMVTALYRKYIDLYYSGNDYIIEKQDLDILSNLYNRKDSKTGYYYVHNSKDMITLDSPAYKATNEKLTKQVNNDYISQKPYLLIDANVNFEIGKPLLIEYTYNNHKASIKGPVVEKAKTSPITREQLIKQISKLGDTNFKVNSINVIIDEGAFLVMKDINNIRRLCAEKLKELIINEV